MAAETRSGLSETLARVVERLRENATDLAFPLADLARTVGADFSALLEFHPSEEKLWLLEGSGLKRAPGERPAEVASSWIMAQAASSSDRPSPIVRRGWEEDQFLSGEGTASLMLDRHSAEGVHFILLAGRRGGKAFEAREENLFTPLAQFLGLAAERSYLVGEVQKWRDRDPLTALPVYHSFYETLRREVSRSRRQGRKISLALVSLEGLEGLRQRKGRPAADGAVKSAADHLKTHLRDNDLVARYGPTEFSILLTDISGALGNMVGDRILRGVAEAARQRDSEISCRMGLAGYPDEATTTEKLIEMAEGALTQAREARSTKAVRWKKGGDRS